MNNQQMQFGGPEYSSEHDPDPRYMSTKTDSREQFQWQQGHTGESSETTYEDGYAGSYQPPLYGEKLRPRATTYRRNNRWLFWLIPGAFLLLLFMGMGTYATYTRFGDTPNFGGPHFDMHGFKQGPQFSASYTLDSFSSESTPTLVIQDNGGSVQIHNGGGNSVTISTTGFFGGDRNMKDGPLNIVQPSNDNHNTATVSVQNTDAPTDLDVTVPTGINVQVEDKTGDVTIDGVNGTVNVTAGDSQVKVSNVQGNVTLNTSDGSINADNITGQVNVSTQAGSVTMNGSVLSGQSVIHTGDGSITFQGTIDTHGSYDFETGTGSIDVTLPAKASFHVIKDIGQGTYSNDFGNDTVGGIPNPPLTVKSVDGSVSIHRN